MIHLVDWFTQQGADVYLTKLSGHYDDSIKIDKVKQSDWEQDMMQSYLVAKENSVLNVLPLVFVGYSLGALLGQAMIVSPGSTVKFDKQVLFAPATAIRKRSYLLKLFFYFNDSIKLPSYTPKMYRANKSLPISIYKILLALEKKILDGGKALANTPAIAFVDPKDELISYKKLTRWGAKTSPGNFEVIGLDTAMKDREGGYHHLIVSEQTMGKKNWQMVTTKMMAFLFN